MTIPLKFLSPLSILVCFLSVSLSPHVNSSTSLTDIDSEHREQSEPQSIQLLNIAPDAWELSHEEENLKVYTFTLDNSGFSAFKAVIIMDHPLSAIFATISDPYSCPNWVEGCIDSGPIIGKEHTERYGFALNYLPWPFHNREVAVKIQTKYDHGETTEPKVEIVMTTDGSKRTNLPNRTVQIEESSSIYQLEGLNQSQTKLTWFQHTDPSGSLPKWLVNAKLIDIPTKSLPKLAELSNSKKYRDAELIFEDGKLIDIILGNNDSVSNLYKSLQEDPKQVED